MPDVNSVPVSPRHPAANAPSTETQAASSAASGQASRQSSTPASRRASQIYPMNPPPLPLASPRGAGPSSAHHHPHAAPPLSPGLAGSVPSFDATAVPMRHPRPLTAAELHHELEKEQEAVVNRLTRELSALRAHSASVASTASSVTSCMHVVDQDIPGPTHPTSARRHRSSSSVSRTSTSAPYAHGSSFAAATTTIPHHRGSVSSQTAVSNDASAAHQARSASVLSTPRYEEVAHHRQELEEVKRENEALKQRIRDLEKALKGNRDAVDGERGRTRAPDSGATGSEPAVVRGESDDVSVPSTTHAANP